MSRFKSLAESFEIWQNQHTPEDFSRLIPKVIRVSQNRLLKEQRAQCAAGNHGFGVDTQCVPGWLVSRCNYCGRQWQSPDVPFN